MLKEFGKLNDPFIQGANDIIEMYNKKLSNRERRHKIWMYASRWVSKNKKAVSNSFERDIYIYIVNIDRILEGKFNRRTGRQTIVDVRKIEEYITKLINKLKQL